MNRIEFTEDLVSVLKGAPLSVLVLLLVAKQPLSAQYIERRTRYSDKLVHSALLLLEEKCLITRNGRYAWQIASTGLQLPLMNLVEASIGENEDPSVTELQEIQSDNSDNLSGTRRNSESEKFRVPSSSSSLTSITPKDLPLLLDADDPEKFRVDENLKTCDRFGIGESKRTSISRLPHVTPRLIIYQCERLKKIGKSIPRDLGLAIFWIEKNRPVPDDWVDPESNSECFYPENVCAQTFSEVPEANRIKWFELLDKISPQFKPAEVDTWLRTTLLVRMDAEGWTLQAGNSFAAGWIREHALERLQSAAGVMIKVES